MRLTIGFFNYNIIFDITLSPPLRLTRINLFRLNVKYFLNFNFPYASVIFPIDRYLQSVCFFGFHSITLNVPHRDVKRRGGYNALHPSWQWSRRASILVNSLAKTSARHWFLRYFLQQVIYTITLLFLFYSARKV